MTVDVSDWIPILGGIVVAPLALLYLARRLEMAILFVVIGVLANVDLPISLAGQPLNTQRVAIFGLFLATLVRLLAAGSAPRVTTSQTTYTLYMLGLAAISAAQGIVEGIGVTETFLPIVFNLVLFNLLVIALDAIPDSRLRRVMMSYFPIALAVAALYFLLEYRNQVTALAGSDALVFRTGTRARANEARNLLNAWAATLVLFIPMAIRPFLEAHSQLRARLMSVAAMVALTAASLTTFSRASVLILVLGGVSGYLLFAIDNGVVSGFWRRHRRRGVSLLIAAIAVISGAIFYQSEDALLSFVSGAWRLRLDATLGLDFSTASRLEVFRETLVALGEAPWLGHGSVQPSVLTSPTENTFLGVVIEFGIVGLIIYVLALWTISSAIYRRWLKGRLSTRFVIPAWWIMYVGLLATNDFIGFSAGTVAMAFMYANHGGRVFGDHSRESKPGDRRALKMSKSQEYDNSSVLSVD